MGFDNVARQSGKRNSLIDGRPRTPNEVFEALKTGTSLEVLIREDTYQHAASRLVYWFTNISKDSGEVYASLTKMHEVIKASSDREVKDTLKTITIVWKLYIRDEKDPRILKPHYRVDKNGKHETPLEFRDRVRQTIRTQVAVLWRIRDITETARKEGHEVKIRPLPLPAPHSNQDFMTELACKSETQMTKCLKNAQEWGYTLRFGGDGKSKSYYLHPDGDPDIMASLEEQYGIHRNFGHTRKSRVGRITLTRENAPWLQSEENRIIDSNRGRIVLRVAKIVHAEGR